MKQSKKSMFNLSDGEEEEFELQSLGALRDDFEDEMPPDDEEYNDGGEATKSKHTYGDSFCLG